VAQDFWSIRFLSKCRDGGCSYEVPHTGRVWWRLYPMLDVLPRYDASIGADDWIDSTDVAPRAREVIARQLDGIEVPEVSLTLRDPKRYAGDFVWEARLSRSAAPPGKSLINVLLDRHTGSVLEVTTR
jgi:hypothetical protein